MPKIKRTREELEAELKDQIASLRHSCAEYDKGNEWQAKNLANVAYLLLHGDGGRKNPLLRQLGMRSSLKLISTLKRHDGADLNFASGSFSNLLSITITIPELPQKRVSSEVILTDEAKSSPVLNTKGESAFYGTLKFNDWYGESIVPYDWSQMSRKNLIFAIRSQDGGSHYDSKLSDNSYLETKLNPIRRISPITIRPLGMEAPKENEHGDMKSSNNTALAMMRQVAWEIDETLKSQSF